MAPVLGINTASCGMKLLRISEHFSGSIIDKLAQSELAMVPFTQRHELIVFCFVSHYFHSLLTDFSFT